MTRLVKLTLKEKHINDFITHFDTVKDKINAFPGCKGMKLLRDENTPGIVFTYSEWESDDDLEKYRTSELFASIWPTVKQWFDQKLKLGRQKSISMAFQSNKQAVQSKEVH